MQKQSPNGKAKWQLAGSERRCVLTSAMGQKRWEKEALAGFFLFISGGERGGRGLLVLPVGDSQPMARRSGWTMARVRSPALGC
jgi:hypothetical protein